MLGLVVSEAQKRAIGRYRSRLSERGLVRFEVLGCEADRELIRTLARRLSEDGPEAAQLRAAMREGVMGGEPRRGGILNALRRSPLVGSQLDLERSRDEAREIDL